jgi:hypothetical protein
LNADPRPSRSTIPRRFTVKHGETDAQRWSYYEEYIKSRRIKRAREAYPGFDDFIVEQIKTGVINRAMDLRDKLPVVCEANPRTIKRFLEKAITLDEAHDRAVEAGGENSDYKRLRKLRQWLADKDTEDDLKEASPAVAPKIIYELSKIESFAKRLRQRLEPDGNN